MDLRRRLATIAAGVVTAPLLVVVVLPSSPASAHGWVTTPASRQQHCADRRMGDCQGVEYEPQSVEAVKGSMLCSGGSRFTVLDNDSRGWPVTSVGSTMSVTWRLTAAHVTTTWEYFVDGRLHQTFNEGNRQPPFNFSHTLRGLPGGRHKILARWNIGDTPMAFYSCLDVNVGGGGGPNPPPNPPPPPPPGGCTERPWAANTVYLSGQTVAHVRRHWQAKWWTQNEAPGSTGEWGVWRDLGPC